jgi:hypothetical protein
VAPGFCQPAPGYGLNPYIYVAPHLRPAVQTQQYPGFLPLRTPAQQEMLQLQGAAYLQGAVQPYPGMYGKDGGQGSPPCPLGGIVFADILAAAAATDGRHAAADSSGGPSISPAGLCRGDGTLECSELLADDAGRLRAWSLFVFPDRGHFHRQGAEGR